MIDHEYAQAALARNAGAEKAGSAGADHDEVKVLHGNGGAAQGARYWPEMPGEGGRVYGSGYIPRPYALVPNFHKLGVMWGGPDPGYC